MTISGSAKVAGVIGWPVAHSLSPRLHTFWLSAHAIDGAYVPLAVRREDFATVIHALQLANFVGVNVTVPHKEEAFAIAHELDDAARATGAVNLLVFREGGRLQGRNTDALGLAASLGAEHGAKFLHAKPAVILGSGGAARAVTLGLGQLGASDIRIVARDMQRAAALITALQPHVPAPLTAFAWNDFARATKNVALLVNATSGGMQGSAALDVSLAGLPLNAIVCDIVYNPLETGLLRAARAAGHRTTDGLGMLMHQAVPAFEAFYGEAPAVTLALRNDLKKALRHG
ncbi:MAG TPA: shikimate dehydrogenase [Rhizomicrobium sp.]|jgi:shikimate dehydrogenase|nr:shikimate dehydrogenase [Rhizomicrobium sp.]